MSRIPTLFLFLSLFFGMNAFNISIAGNLKLADAQSDAAYRQCFNQCVKEREQCKSSACTSNSGRTIGNQGCNLDPKYREAYSKALNKCSDAEGLCKSKC